ncbi:MAG: TlpA family protein disulfide reductase [Synergistaceae bacterium]|jgi:thiol-disulfide isomerase/thioredoxin|nr:TlpA family protein disulfide reductase [Synergistaceae bacterium]
MRNLSRIIILSAVLALVAFLFSGMGSAADVFPAFSARSLEGHAVTDAIFADKKLTMVNIWTTWCPPCIAEMPDLGKLANSMPEGSQLVGIILDADDPNALDEAQKILSKANAKFPQILPADVMSPVLEEVQAIPTTIFVDADRNIVGKPLVGSRSEKAYRSEIEKLLKTL